MGAFDNYSFSNSLKTLVDPFASLIKKPAATTTPTALFTPAPTPIKPPATPALNYTPLPQTSSQYMTPLPAKPATPATPAATGSYTVKSGDTLSAIAARSGMTLSQLIAINPQFASNPNLIRPGQSVALSGTPSNAPAPVSAPAKPVVPQVGAPASQSAPQAPAGSQNSPSGTPSAPVTPSVPPESLKALETAEKAYAEAQKISPEELSTQEDLDKLIESTKTAYRNTSGQAIPLEFITGQLKSIEQRATGLAEPLERKLARMQAARTSAIEGSKFALERADKALAGERERVATAKTEAESTRRFEATQGESKRQFDLNYRLSEAKFAEDKRQFGLDYANKQREIAVKEAEAAQSGESGSYQSQKTGAIIASVNDLMGRISNKTVGVGSYASAIRGTEAYNFKSDLDTLKSNIAFGELQAMRAASKTGGALGAVSEKELTLLESALGALDQGQSPENMKKNLQKIYDSLARWETAVSTSGSAASSSTGGGSSFTSPSGATYKLPY